MIYRGKTSECERLQALDRKANSLPVRGVHVGGGRHVDLDATDPTKGGSGVGWTLQINDVTVEDPKADVAKYPVADKAPAVLTTAEKLEYSAAIEDAVVEEKVEVKPVFDSAVVADEEKLP